MVNKKKALGMLVIVLVFAIMVIGCNRTGASSLEGIWIAEDGSELELNDGNFEVRYDQIIIAKGTYTVSGDSKTLINTHYNGLFLDLGPELYTRSELEAILKSEYDFPIEEMDEFFEADFLDYIDQFLDEVFEMVVFNFSITGNTLAWTMDGIPVLSYTKKQ
ncbi:MAG: hypothetical protein LBC80_05900 [Treponema sp.]|jgi:hypothetical protein|nr:hypothetical protein [Treponema sp.]